MLPAGLRLEIWPPTQALCGAGVALELPTLLEARGWSKPGVVVDAAVAETLPAIAAMERLAAAYGDALHVVRARTDSEPSYQYLDTCAAEFRARELDCLVGMGGGSTMDLCKGVAVLCTNPGTGIEYRGMNLVERPSVPTVLLPTTAGTGSETTPTAVFVDTATKTKMGINGRYLDPKLAVLDPDLTASCPHRVTVASGLDAIVHALEAYMTCTDHPVAHATAVGALEQLFTAFPAAIGDAEAEGARLEMLLGAYLAGVTLRYSGGGVMGALSYPLGAQFGVPHGLAGGLLIPHVVRLNIAAGYEGYATLEHRLGGDGGSEGFQRRVESLLDVIGAPRDFEGYAVTRADIPGIVEQTHSQRAAVLAANPARIDDAYLTEILEAVVPA